MVTRPVPGNAAATLDSINSLCDAVDAAASLLAAHQATMSGLQSAVAAEGAARGAGDTAEANARIAGDAAVTAGLRNSISTAVQGLRVELGSLGDSLRSLISAETQARTTADAAEQTARQAAFDSQAAALTAAVQNLYAAIAKKADVSAVDAGGDDQAQALADGLAALRKITDAITATVVAQRLEYVAVPGRPGDAPGRYTFVFAAAALAGARAALPALPVTMLANGDSGPVARIVGAGILAMRAALALEPGRVCRARFVVQRRANPSDPTGDAVVCGLVYLDQSFRLVGSVVPVQAYPALITARGRQPCEALISRTASGGVAFTAPASARFVVPVVVTYGLDAVTDVEVLLVEDVTGSFVMPAPVADFESRLARLEAENAAARLQVLESEIGTPSKLVFKSKGDAAYATIPDTVEVVELLGRSTAGDGGAGLYARTADPLPAGADSFNSHGAVFVRVVPAADVAAVLIRSGFTRFEADLPREIPTAAGQAFSDGGTPKVSQ